MCFAFRLTVTQGKNADAGCPWIVSPRRRRCAREVTRIGAIAVPTSAVASARKDRRKSETPEYSHGRPRPRVHAACNDESVMRIR